MDADIEIVRPNKNPLMPNLLKAKFEINRARIKTVIGIVRLYDDLFNLAFIDAISASGFLTQIPILFFLGPNILSILCGKAGCPAILSTIRFANNAILSGEGTESAEGIGSALLFIMGPHSDDLDNFLIFNNLVNQPMLNVYTS